MNDKNDTAGMVNDLLCARIKELEEDRDALVKQIEEYEHKTTCPACITQYMLKALSKQSAESEAEDYELTPEPEQAGDADEPEALAVVSVTADMGIKTPQDLPKEIKQRLASEGIEIDKVQIVLR